MVISKQLDYKLFKMKLLRFREKIVISNEKTKGDRDPVELDQSQQGRLSRIDAIQVQEMALEQERRRRIEIVRIDEALKRLDKEEFGFCNICGEQIELKRLEVDPANPLCLGCAR